ncbi:MAG: trigger factor [Alphaproteobacteria bacterium]|nr:trigger factor [Alphaproteobacteria bacterium]
MQITETLADGLKHDFRVVVPAEDLRSKIDDKLAEYGANMRLPGFRPGKAPLKILRQRFGRAVEGEILEDTINRGTQQAIEERGLKPAVMPQIDMVSDLANGLTAGVDLEYTVSVEALPDIEPIDFASLELERLEAEPADETVGEEIERIARATAELAPVEEDRGAAEGDTLTIDFEGKIDGEAFAGGAAEDYEIELGTGEFIPGFEDQLVGARAGESRDVEVEFPEEYNAAHLAGKAAVFSVEVKEIRERKAVDPDDEMAKRIGFDDLASLRQSVVDRIKGHYGGVARMVVKRQLFDRLEQEHDFPLPESMVETEFESIWGEIEKRLEDSDAAEEVREGKTDDELREEYRKVAERRIRLGLLLAEVGRQNNIEVNQEDLQRAMASQVQQFPGQEQVVLDFYRKNPSAMSQFEGPILENKVVEFILELAQVTTREVSAEELIAASEGVSEEE